MPLDPSPIVTVLTAFTFVLLEDVVFILWTVLIGYGIALLHV